ncbi:hypothetical protein JCM11491_000478 [Sporobolomyces phaffii]
MLLNEATTLYTPRLVLRPYRRWHVPQYHAWMEDPTVREQTASERLSMQEEEEMQQSWRLDEDKLTFIVHLRSPTAPSPETDPTGFLRAHNDASTMLGDVNLFLHSSVESDSDEDDEARAVAPLDEPTRRQPPRATTLAELEIMLPTTPTSLYRPRTGLALETLHAFVAYAQRHLELAPSQFIAKIGFDNLPSLALFRKLGFVETKRVEVFREVEMGWPTGTDESTSQGRWSWEGQGWELGVLDDPRNPETD